MPDPLRVWSAGIVSPTTSVPATDAENTSAGTGSEKRSTGPRISADGVENTSAGTGFREAGEVCASVSYILRVPPNAG
uniref:Uncharacterized protein n=1 Tax=Mycena chlorophos TaxID=658473 RepID=A0ABQ0KYV3_MYCCL|nr:predicted protein [Mycena chlorophos]